MRGPETCAGASEAMPERECPRLPLEKVALRRKKRPDTV